MQDPNNASNQMNESGASAPKDVVGGTPGLGTGGNSGAAVNGERTVATCRYYGSDDSDFSDDGEVRAKGDGKSKRAGVPHYTQPGSPVYPPHYPRPQAHNTGGQAPQPGRGQPSYTPAYAPQPSAYAQQPQPPAGYRQGGQSFPGAAPHTAQQQQHPRAYTAPPPGGQRGYPYTQAPAAPRNAAPTQGQASTQKAAPKKK